MRCGMLKKGEVSPTVFLWVALVIGLALQARGVLPMHGGYMYPPDGYGFLPDPYAPYQAAVGTYQEGPYDQYYQPAFYTQ